MHELPAKVARHYGIAPVKVEAGSLQVLAKASLSREVCKELQVMLGLPIRFEVVSAQQVDRLTEETYGVGAEMIETLAPAQSNEALLVDIEDLSQLEGQDATVLRLVNEILSDGIKRGASDIHIEPFETRLRIRYRVDGILEEANVSDQIRFLASSLISRVKIMAKLDIGEKRLPQDGRIKVKMAEETIDLRVSVLPSAYGEAIVIRILKPLVLRGLEELGFDSKDLLLFRKQLNKPNGMVLVTGPTGSGKTTTLYAALQEINSVERKVITVEDPVEYKLSGMIQMQVHEKIGFTFAKALRSILRHDPDTIMVGEIRDQETAEIAIRAALTGHLVFSTLHTNDAPSAISRLIEMGIPPYLVASSVEAVLAQRLVRRLDANGYLRGRTVVHELMEVSEAMKDLVMTNATTGRIRQQATLEGMRSMAECGQQKIQTGVTTSDELKRVVI